MIGLSASIVLYKNDPAILRKTIRSFLDSSLKGNLMLVDNSPTDELRSLSTEFNVTYHFNGANHGFGKAHNQAIQSFLHQAEYHLVLNPDVYFGKEVLTELYHFMENHPQVGLVMPKVLYPDGSVQPLCKLLPNPFILAIRRFFPFKNMVSRINDRYEMKSLGYDRVMNVPFLSGCFMFLRTAVLKEVGLFDENFFLYAEDTDLSRRIHHHYKTIYYPTVAIHHLHARGSYKDFFLTAHNLRSAAYYFNKYGWFWDADRKRINNAAEKQTPLALQRVEKNVLPVFTERLS